MRFPYVLINIFKCVARLDIVIKSKNFRRENFFYRYTDDVYKSSLKLIKLFITEQLKGKLSKI